MTNYENTLDSQQRRHGLPPGVYAVVAVLLNSRATESTCDGAGVAWDGPIGPLGPGHTERHTIVLEDSSVDTDLSQAVVHELNQSPHTVTIGDAGKVEGFAALAAAPPTSTHPRCDPHDRAFTPEIEIINEDRTHSRRHL